MPTVQNVEEELAKKEMYDRLCNSDEENRKKIIPITENIEQRIGNLDKLVIKLLKLLKND